MLDPETVEGGAEAIARHPSTAMRARAVPELDLGEEDEMGERSDDDDEEEDGQKSAWASVTVDGRDWGKVLGIGRLGGRVVACFVDRHALILYVYISPDGVGGDESVVTVSLHPVEAVTRASDVLIFCYDPVLHKLIQSLRMATRKQPATPSSRGRE